MTLEAAVLARLRRMVAEPTTAVYADADLEYLLTQFPLSDSENHLPDQTGWIPTYDLHAAASEVWTEKAASLQALHDFSADGSSFSRNQLYENAMNQARYHSARRKAQARKVEKWPTEVGLSA